MTTKLPDGRGFDIVVWQKRKAAEVFCAAYTVNGVTYLAKWIPSATMLKIQDMGVIHPKEFIGQAPKGLKIGGVSPGAKAPMLINPSLH